MPYTHLTCYFLSGTGNSFRAAEWLAGAARERGVEVAVIPIGRARPAEDLRPGPEQLVGFYHPAHGLMPPWSMIKFLLRLPRGRGAHAAIVSTRGGIRIGSWVLPGACGLAVLFPLLWLWLKGYRVRAALGIDMPVNMISLHWGLAPHNVEHILALGHRRHARLAIPSLALPLVSIALTFLALPLLYYLFWGLLRLRPLHVMFSYTTLTRCWRRRYHEHKTQLKHLR